MADPTPAQLRMAVAAGLHIGAAAAGVLACMTDMGKPRAEVRAEFLRICTELFDETAAEIPET
jgi:hypothetical protein